MRTNRQKYPDLNDLAFSGRNKDYGSYFLRKKYPRSLLFAFIFSVIIVLLIILIPFGIYYLKGSNPNYNEDEIYSVEYTFIPSPDEDLSSIAKAMAKPPESAVEKVPEVVDKVIPEKKKEPEEVKKVEDDVPKSDSAGAPGTNTQTGTGSTESNGIFTTIDVYPRFPGGDQARLYFIRSNVRYPLLSLKMGVQGRVMVVFVIEPDGSISNVSVGKGVAKDLDDEAIRVTKSMPRWEPGRRKGKSVRVMLQMPIVFTIPGKK